MAGAYYLQCPPPPYLPLFLAVSANGGSPTNVEHTHCGGGKQQKCIRIQMPAKSRQASCDGRLAGRGKSRGGRGNAANESA